MKLRFILLLIGGCTAFALPPLPSQLRSPLPVEIVEVLDGAKFKIRVPANWNGTLLVYPQGTKITPSPDPAIVAPVARGTSLDLETALIERGHALAASDAGTLDMQVKETVQDSLQLTAYFRAAIGDPKRILLWGTSLGGLVSLKMIEDYPRTFDGAVATCAPAAGFPRGMDRHLDFSIAYAAAFGWPEEKWGPVGDLREGLNFSSDVLPNANIPKQDGSNRGGWEFIRLVYGASAEAFWTTNPVCGQPGWLINLFQATATRALNESYAAGPFTQNLNRHYTLTASEKTYLAGLGVNADELLAKMNAITNTQASPVARDYADRFGSLRGFLRRPVITLHNSADNVVDVRQESAYRSQVEWWGLSDHLVQAYVRNPGHCAFTSQQLLATLDAMERWLETGVRPDAASFPEALNFDNSFVPDKWPY